MALLRGVLFACAGLAAMGGVAGAQGQGQTPTRARVDLVLAVDVSGSMRGLIDGTRMKLWEAVRLLGRAKPVPTVRVGLISYGGKAYDPRNGYVKKELDLTTDLDAVSAKLFALSVRGSEEYVARAVQTATRQMSWDQDPSTLKILFVAGNESAEQDPLVSLASALGEARQRNILVNAIFCGREEAREAVAWRRVAALGGGEFAAIDHNRSVLAARSPYDAELTRLSTALSSSYVGYGAHASQRRANQAAEDARAIRDGASVAADRAAAKAAPTYSNADWDVVDAYAAKKKAPLPTDVAALPDNARESWLRGKLEERQQLRRRIGELATEREQWLATTTPAPRPVGAQPSEKVYAFGGLAVNGTSATKDLGKGMGGTATEAAAPAASPPAPATPAPVAVAAAPSPRSAAEAKPAKRPSAAKPAASLSDAFSGAIQRTAVKNGYAF